MTYSVPTPARFKVPFALHRRKRSNHFLPHQCFRKSNCPNFLVSLLHFYCGYNFLFRKIFALKVVLCDFYNMQRLAYQKYVSWPFWMAKLTNKKKLFCFKKIFLWKVHLYLKEEKKHLENTKDLFFERSRVP